MAFQRRGVALDHNQSVPPSSNFDTRDTELATVPTIMESQTVPALAPVSTIAPFDTGLNGVNQEANILFQNILWWSLGIVALVVLGIRIVELCSAYVRLITSMSLSGAKQKFWKIHQWSWMPGLKRRLLYAPLWKKRHNREIRLSAAVNIGTLPSRLHAILLLGYLASNLAYMFILDWKNINKYSLCAEIRGRSGTLALVNMLPLIILATRNNPLIPMLKVSFDTYNLLHRWMGRVVVAEVVIHTTAWAVVQVADGGWESVNSKIMQDRFISSGMIGTLAMVFIFVLSVSPVRHAFYETFLTTHIIFALVAFVGTWVHCVASEIPGGLPQLPWIVSIMVLWLAERMARMVRLAYCNWAGGRFTDAIIESMPGETTRVTLRLPRFVNVQPGQHAYLRFSRINPWENHPFSIAWIEHTYEDEILPISEKEAKTIRKPVATAVSFVIGAQTGVTRKLYDQARSASNGCMVMSAAFEGPYAGHHSLDSYGHVVLFAGATGITHQISYLKHLLQGFADGTVATRRIVLVWIIRDYDALEWVRPWMDAILRMPHRKELVKMKLFITRPKNPAQVHSSSSTVQIFPGRPNIPMLLTKEVQEQVGAMCVTVCGPGALADDVRDAVRMVQDEGNVVDLVEESFTW